jgi:hypothetical protein
MKFYNKQHKYYRRIDLHTKKCMRVSLTPIAKSVFCARTETNLERLPTDKRVFAGLEEKPLSFFRSG